MVEKLAVQLLLPLATDIAVNNKSIKDILNAPFPGTDNSLEINLSAVLVAAQLLTKDEGVDALIWPRSTLRSSSLKDSSRRI